MQHPIEPCPGHPCPEPVDGLRRGRVDLDRDRQPFGVLHLGGDGPHPDQLVQPELVTGQPGLGRRQEGLARPAGSPRAPPGRS